jgi:hypothetical protein
MGPSLTELVWVFVCTKISLFHFWNQHILGDEVIGFFNWPNPSSRTMTLGSSQPLTEMSTTNLPGGKGRPQSGADNLTAICESIA